MRTVCVDEEEETIEFAKIAADHFQKNEHHYTFTVDGTITPGDLFAVRWGMDNDGVVVFRASISMEPVNFAEITKGAK